MTVGLGLRKDISLNVNYLERHLVHVEDYDRYLYDWYSGEYLPIHYTDIGWLTTREISWGCRFHLSRLGKGFYFGVTQGVARHEYSRLLKCFYDPHETYLQYGYVMSLVQNFPETKYLRFFISPYVGIHVPLGQRLAIGLEPSIILEKDNIRVSALATLGHY